MSFTTVAAEPELALAGTGDGWFAVWAAPSWRGGFVDAPGAEAVTVLRRMEGTIETVVCDETCRRRVFEGEMFSAPSTVPRPAAVLSGRLWQPRVLEDGRRGWVNAAYLRPAAAPCP